MIHLVISHFFHRYTSEKKLKFHCRAETLSFLVVVSGTRVRTIQLVVSNTVYRASTQYNTKTVVVQFVLGIQRNAAAI